MIKNGMRPVHPGEVLREDYLKPLHMSANALARHLLVPLPASMTSCSNGAASRLIRPCGSATISAVMRSPG